MQSSILDGMDSDEKKEAAGGDDFVDIKVSERERRSKPINVITYSVSASEFHP